jgi:hypothetical protein
VSIASGRKFCRLAVVREVSPDIFECKCACGNLLTVWRSLLVGNIQRDCGCVYPRRSVHGHTRTFKTRDGRTLEEIFRVPFVVKYDWSFLQRESSRLRGLREKRYSCMRTVAAGRTGQGFKNFLDDMGPRPAGKTLDRINPQSHYCPDNCRWASSDVQGRNKRIHLWPDPETMPPVESYREMEARIEADFAEMHGY